ncbi:amidase family protein [Phenylobacterium montanum]|uniref:Amidase n=1 Tax=Phenylobacterium montanum TaxID=2823693 RepID=A0A975FVY4_9CAUL|nr:amidase family protein [Caulobacter sp. S6]QUD86284.1 amidase [Caulobacter sp. S6]
MSDILSLDALGQLQALVTKRISAVELLEAAIARRQETKGLNAVVATDLTAARERARTVDERRIAGEPLGPFAGLPMTIKDTFDVDGLPASAGVKALLNRTAHDAEVVARARAAGAIPWGKTNVPVMAGDWQSYNDVYGTTNNPWDVTRVPGGSSGGAAAALSVGITALEIGSDIGGSLRVPANFCGVLSHKPTWGLVSQSGHVPPAPGAYAARDLNVVGPMARSARDLRLLLSVIAQGPIAPKAQPAALKGLKVGLWIDEPSFPLDPEVKAVVEAFGARLAGAGCEVETIRPVDAPALITAYTTLLSSVVATDLPTKVQADMQRLRGMAKLAMRFGADPMGWAGQVLAYSATHAEWLAAHETRERLAVQVKATFDKRDVIIAPISPVTAFPHDHKPFQKRVLKQSDGKTIPYVSMLNWIALATALGLPATVLPAGLAKSGRPVGVQIIGPHGGDSRTLAVAEGIEEAFGGYLKPPPEIGGR